MSPRIALLGALVALTACSIGAGTEEFAENDVSFRYPEGWHVAGFSTTNSPPRLAVASYPLPEDAVEGDCGGYEAVRRLPRAGALVILIDYGWGRGSGERSGRLTLGDGEYAEYECFGPSTLFRFRVGDHRDFQAHVSIGAEASHETRDRALAVLESLDVHEPEPFVPETRREGDRLVMPLTFPDGTTAELVYPADLEFERFTIRPYGSGRLRGNSPTPDRGDVVGRDLFVVNGDVNRVVADMNDERPPVPLAWYEAPDRQQVGLWDVRGRTNVNYLGFQFGRWAVLVYDYKAAGEGAMTDAERTSWVESFRGHETDDGWLVLEAESPLRLARAGEHAGPQLTFGAQDPERGLGLHLGTCRPHRDQDRVVAGKQVEWRGGFADWCVSDLMRIHASGPRQFIGALIRGLEVRRVVLAG